MSFHAMRMVLEHAKPEGPTQMLVLLIIGDQAEDDGVMKFPRTNAWLAKRARLADGSTVSRVLKQLDESSQIRTVNGNGHRAGFRHRLLLPGLKSANSRPGKPVHPAQGDLLTASVSGSQPDGTGSQPDEAWVLSSLGTSLSFPIDPTGADAPEGVAAPSGGFVVVSTKEHARRLAIAAMEQPVKPVIRNASNPFLPVMKIFESLIAAGTDPDDLARAVTTGIDVWTLAGVQTAVARARPNRGTRRRGMDSLADELRRA